MGHLDEAAFATAIKACARCSGTAFEIATYLDRQLAVMLGEHDDDGKWAHDGEKFIDGVYRIRCTGCGADAYASDDCPRCHRAGALADGLATTTRLAVPKRCPSCNETQLILVGFAPATARAPVDRRVTPTPTALLGDPGFHVVAMMCDSCDWVAAAPGCPICGGPGPLRPRP